MTHNSPHNVTTHNFVLENLSYVKPLKNTFLSVLKKYIPIIANNTADFFFFINAVC